MSIADTIRATPPPERRLLKAQLLAALPVPGPFEVGDFEITITSIGVEGDRLKVEASATRSGVTVSVDNPLYFLNPPVKVRRGAAMVEDPQQALKEIVADTIRITTR
jgi:hypothetical protein